MPNNDRSTNNETDSEGPEAAEQKDSVDRDVPFIETLDPETRAQVDEVLERSLILARDVITALNRR